MFSPKWEVHLNHCPQESRIFPEDGKRLQDPEVVGTFWEKVFSAHNRAVPIWVHSGCDSTHRPVQAQARCNPTMEYRKVSVEPLPELGSVGIE